jgi:hypothetical protein
LTKVAPSNGAFYIYVDTSDAVPDSVSMPLYYTAHTMLAIVQLTAKCNCYTISVGASI